jgi:hypothetical protein
MTGKHRKGPFRARNELIKSSGERSQKVELKTWQGRILEINMSCLFGGVQGFLSFGVNGHFTGKRHWDRVTVGFMF